MSEARTSELIDQLRQWGVRVTAQRLAVAEVLMSSNDHPTAQDVYDRVQARFPHITMGTVYNTINTLAGKGLIQSLAFPDGARYDTNASPHVNLVCLRCGSIEDVVGGRDALADLRSRIAKDASFEVVSQRMDLYGFCARCGAPADQRVKSAPDRASTARTRRG